MWRVRRMCLLLLNLVYSLTPHTPQISLLIPSSSFKNSPLILTPQILFHGTLGRSKWRTTSTKYWKSFSLLPASWGEEQSFTLFAAMVTCTLSRITELRTQTMRCIVVLQMTFKSANHCFAVEHYLGLPTHSSIAKDRGCLSWHIWYWIRLEFLCHNLCIYLGFWANLCDYRYKFGNMVQKTFCGKKSVLLMTWRWDHPAKPAPVHFLLQYMQKSVELSSFGWSRAQWFSFLYIHHLEFFPWPCHQRLGIVLLALSVLFLFPSVCSWNPCSQNSPQCGLWIGLVLALCLAHIPYY